MIKIKSYGSNWKKIYLWCKNSDSISQFYTDMAHNIGRKIDKNINLSDKEIFSGHLLLEELASKSDVLQRLDE